jgi:hypothetical protein
MLDISDSCEHPLHVPRDDSFDIDAPGNISANFLEFFCHERLTKSRTPFILSGFQRLGP